MNGHPFFTKGFNSFHCLLNVSSTGFKVLVMSLGKVVLLQGDMQSVNEMKTV